MGGAVSSGESNDDLVDNLLEADYIKHPLVERVFRAVDRALYYTPANKKSAYKDLAWKDGNLHMSAPCIYSEVMENLKLGPGMSFLNIGSGTGYLSTMCGLLIGRNGMNHGIELHADVTDYARNKLEEFLRTSPAIDLFDFCRPQFVVGNCLDPISAAQRYDRIYCGAACPEEYISNITDLLKIGGVCVIPINDSLVQITRSSEEKFDRKALLPVSFATLIQPPRNGTVSILEKKAVILPQWNPLSLKEICRSEIRQLLRISITTTDDRPKGEERKKKKRKRRHERRRASRLLVVQRRRSGADDGETGFVAVAYSLGNHSSDEENDSNHGRNGEGRRGRRMRGGSRNDSSTESDSEDDRRPSGENAENSSDVPPPLKRDEGNSSPRSTPEKEDAKAGPSSASKTNMRRDSEQANGSSPSKQAKSCSDGLSSSYGNTATTSSGSASNGNGNGLFKSAMRHRVLLNRSSRLSRGNGSPASLGLYGRLREQCRRNNEQERDRSNNSGSLLYQYTQNWQQNLQQISSAAARVVRNFGSNSRERTASSPQMMDVEEEEQAQNESNSDVEPAARHETVEAATSTTATRTLSASNGPDEEREEGPSSLPSASSGINEEDENSTRRNNRERNHNDEDEALVWSTDSSLESSSSTSSSSGAEDEEEGQSSNKPCPVGRGNGNRTSGSTESGVVISDNDESKTNKKKDNKADKHEEKKDPEEVERARVMAKLTGNYYTQRMKENVDGLPIAPAVKGYLNYYRQF